MVFVSLGEPLVHAANGNGVEVPARLSLACDLQGDGSRSGDNSRVTQTTTMRLGRIVECTDARLGSVPPVAGSSFSTLHR